MYLLYTKGLKFYIKGKESFKNFNIKHKITRKAIIISIS